MFDRIIAAVKLETPDPSRWRAQLHSLLGRLRAELVTHPGMAAATMVDPPRTEVAMRLLENLLGILLAGGLDAQDAAWAADILAAQVTYAAIEAELGAPTPAHWLPKSRPTSPACRPTTFRSSLPTPLSWSPRSRRTIRLRH